MVRMTGLSGNEIYCLSLKGYTPGELVVGNSVFSMGFLGGLSALGSSFVGGEVAEVTSIIHEGRQNALDRMVGEAEGHGGEGITGVSSELTTFHGRSEFLSVASVVHVADRKSSSLGFSTSANGQDLYCQLDAGFRPLRFVFGNVAFSIGVGSGIVGALKTMGRGEIKEYSDIFNKTRHLALHRIASDAHRAGANSVIGIETRAIHLGYMPVKLVLGTAVYSLGIVGGLKAWFRSITRGEIPELTSLIYEAREHAIGMIRDEAAALNADSVVGIKTHIHEHNNLLEFMAIGTAVKKMPELTTLSEQLPPQAIIRDKDTWVSKVALHIPGH